MNQRAIQDQFQKNNYCWGCGRLSDHGLELKSYWTGDEAVATWQPRSYHAAGPPNVVNGGIIATIIDCHSACTAMAAGYQAEGREIGREPHIWCATASLQVTYLRRTPVDGPLILRAQVKEMGEEDNRHLLGLRQRAGVRPRGGCRRTRNTRLGSSRVTSGSS